MVTHVQVAHSVCNHGNYIAVYYRCVVEDCCSNKKEEIDTEILVPDKTCQGKILVETLIIGRDIDRDIYRDIDIDIGRHIS